VGGPVASRLHAVLEEDVCHNPRAAEPPPAIFPFAFLEWQSVRGGLSLRVRYGLPEVRSGAKTKTQPRA